MYLSKTHFTGFTFSLSLCTLTLLLSFVFGTSAEGWPHVIGALQPVIAAPGDDVILPCYVDPPVSVRDLSVEWSKPDLKSDPSDPQSRVRYVHVYRGRREDVNLQIGSYAKRTTLFTDALERGNISLQIKNVTLADQGRYRCFIPKINTNMNDAVVQLVVDPKFVKMSPSEPPLQPRDHQTPGPEDTTHVTGGRSHLALWIPTVVVIILLMVLGGAVGGYLAKHKVPPYEAAHNKPAPA
uniref:myelin-oligodendrocyte glycoprotein-like isoform X2 n=1 Tax=Monopterus albus TaxID=43700 RepID=UPI0009B4D1CC|nr:myelin-oligodendrocyte glycoprotein-like isoform X2 [Monopterus albus]